LQTYVEATVGSPEKPVTRSPSSRMARAAHDIIEGLEKYWLWNSMAFQDIKLRYRGSLLGPLWLTFSTAIMIGSMGIIYPHLFHTDVHSYLPFLAIGLVIWQIIQTMVSDGCQVFISAQEVILQAPMPFSVHVYRMVARNFIILGHNLLIIPFVLLIFSVPTSITALQAVPALILVAINGVWLGLFFGMASARFRDIPPVVASVFQVLFFITPVFWAPEVLGKWETLFELNPIFAAIDVIRAPLLGKSPANLSWLVLLFTTFAGSAFTFAFFARFRSRIAFWI
jgi:ABC-type polysaccharide/polyol phosphate export permease